MFVGTDFFGQTGLSGLGENKNKIILFKCAFSTVALIGDTVNK